MTGPKTNERPGTRAKVSNVRMSASKARVVLDLIRNLPVDEAQAVLAYTERGAAEVIGKCLDSAVANAANNDGIDPETLFVSACYADEGRTLYRFRPRARGRATRIRKRTCHITVIVSAMSGDMLIRAQSKRENIPGSRAARRRGQEAAERASRVAKSQPAEADTDEADTDESTDADVLDTDAEVVDTTEVAAAEAQLAEDTDAEVAAPEGDDTAAEDAGIVDTTEAAAEAADDATADDASDEEK